MVDKHARADYQAYSVINLTKTVLAETPPLGIPRDSLDHLSDHSYLINQTLLRINTPIKPFYFSTSACQRSATILSRN